MHNRTSFSKPEYLQIVLLIYCIIFVLAYPIPTETLRVVTSLSQRVGRLNLDWVDPSQSSEREDEAFQHAMKVAGTEFMEVCILTFSMFTSASLCQNYLSIICKLTGRLFLDHT
jgi:hypothetical protein